MHTRNRINICFIVDYLICGALYLLIKINCFGTVGIIRCYGNDVICGYVFSCILKDLYKIILKEDIDNKFQLQILIFASVYWELISPIFIEKSVSDIYDIGAYLIGYIIYILINYIKKEMGI